MFLFAKFYGTTVNSVEVSIANNNMYADGHNNWESRLKLAP